jgi:two-component system LytT family response regulator
MLQALLIDDEINNLNSLSFLLENDCAGIRVAGCVTSAAEARAWLALHHADVVFLDINMPNENGFQFLDSLGSKNFRTVFVTAFDQYAIQAIKASALDYLLKPVSIEELRLTVEKIKRSFSSTGNTEQHKKLLEHFLQIVQQRSAPTKIALPHLGGISFVEVDQIVSLQADSNYTIIHLNSMQKMVISKTLKDFEELLNPEQFARIHKSYIVNLRYLKEYSTTDGGIVKMTDGNQWSISRRQVESFLEKMKAASLMFNK